jgi:hypothetical protein
MPNDQVEQSCVPLSPKLLIQLESRISLGSATRDQANARAVAPVFASVATIARPIMGARPGDQCDAA